MWAESSLEMHDNARVRCCYAQEWKPDLERNVPFRLVALSSPLPPTTVFTLYSRTIAVLSFRRPFPKMRMWVQLGDLVSGMFSR